MQVLYCSFHDKYHSLMAPLFMRVGCTKNTEMLYQYIQVYFDINHILYPSSLVPR